jgi:hypothetical protein
VVLSPPHSIAIHLLRQVAQVDREMGLTPERVSLRDLRSLETSTRVLERSVER